MHKFRVTMTDAHHGKVFIDDQKIPGVCAVEFSASSSPDVMAVLKLTFLTSEIVVEGVADITTMVIPSA